MKTKFKFLILSIMIIVLNQSCFSDKTSIITESITEVDDNVNTTTDALTALKEGNKRFYSGQARHIHQDSATFKKLVTGQNPKAVVISCSDSRVPPEIVFDQGLGDIFSIRTAGNIMGDYEEGSVEYAVKHLGTSLIVVMGHEGCGAIGAFLEHLDDDDVEGHIASIIKKIKEEEEEKEAILIKDNLKKRAVRANVAHGVQTLRTSDPILAKLYQEEKLTIVGAVYDIETGKVEFLDL